MSSDIVERLRRISGGSSVVELARDAAAEMERLRAEVERLRAAGDALVATLRRHLSQAIAVIETQQAETERLRALGDALADAAIRQQWSRLDVAVAAWQEARRG